MKTQQLARLFVPIVASLVLLTGCDLGDKNVGDENDSGAATGDGGDAGSDGATDGNDGNDGNDGSGSASGGDTYEPCGDLSCGDPCSTCPPDDPECIETAEVKVCNDAGECVSDSGDVLCEAYNGCADAKCGDPCTICAPDDPDCEETEEAKSCNADGVCVAEFGGDLCEPVWDPCGALECGDACMLCPPQGMGDDDCVETADRKVCTADGLCVSDAGEDLMCEGAAEFACGDSLLCIQEAEYCDVVVGGQPGGGGADCVDMPKACSATPTCACLEPIVGPFGGATECEELPGGGVSLTTFAP